MCFFDMLDAIISLFPSFKIVFSLLSQSELTSSTSTCDHFSFSHVRIQSLALWEKRKTLRFKSVTSSLALDISSPSIDKYIPIPIPIRCESVAILFGWKNKAKISIEMNQVKITISRKWLKIRTANTPCANFVRFSSRWKSTLNTTIPNEWTRKNNLFFFLFGNFSCTRSPPHQTLKCWC